MPGAEKTEQPTGRRISEARKKGQVANSRELTQAVVLLSGILFLGAFGKQIFSGLENSIYISVSSFQLEQPTFENLRNLIARHLQPFVLNLGLMVGGLLLIGMFSTLLQTNFLWAADRVGINLSRVRLNPFAWFQQVFSLTGFFELGKAILKLFIVGWVAYSFLNEHTNDFLGLAQIGTINAFYKWSGLAYDMCIRVAGSYLVLAIADYLYQRWSTLRQLKMTKEEVKDEMIQHEGNPTIKGALRSKQRQMAFMRMMASVPKADVVITNPTHLAIAVQYTSEMRAPKVIAKGQRLVAERIVKIALTHNIPIVQNVPVARALFNSVDVEHEIPPELYLAVAEILVYIYRMKGTLPEKTPSRARPTRFSQSPNNQTTYGNVGIIPTNGVPANPETPQI